MPQEIPSRIRSLTTVQHQKTLYMALTLSMIEATDAYHEGLGQVRVRNLIRQGWVPLKVEEMLAFVDYAMSPQARSISLFHANKLL